MKSNFKSNQRKFNTYELTDHLKTIYKKQNVVSPLEMPNETGDASLNKMSKNLKMVSSKTDTNALKLVEQGPYYWDVFLKLTE